MESSPDLLDGTLFPAHMSASSLPFRICIVKPFRLTCYQLPFECFVYVANEALKNYHISYVIIHRLGSLYYSMSSHRDEETRR